MDFLLDDHISIKENALQGRYVTHGQIQEVLRKLPALFSVRKIGESVQGRSIESITFGSGDTKILMWSQMHGNESTTTKAVFDLMGLVRERPDKVADILEKCTITIIPMLNPDGAEVYTRVNANGVDLNRDAQERSQPESVVLRQEFENLAPDFCFNLHDQRTIFNVGETARPATVSFLAPAHDEERSISGSRALGMKLIVAMNEALQQIIPGRVGRYDDSFNANCVGDTFQMLGTPTVLFESGHSPNDYQREDTRKYIFISLLKALTVITEGALEGYALDKYSEIPENRKQFVDIMVRNAGIINEKLKEKGTFAFLYQEVLEGGAIRFVPKMVEIEPGRSYFAHQYFDCSIPSDLQKLKTQSYYPMLKF
ncbi:M14 family metallopeptidase [Pseudozobellia thermophila]|uniref:Zinc carboxypeptidase n=1 Tax=Pseudozobellia thermophila TaxID=192903 RepID=A0A1M6EY58_9FLAO|nr:M14 metallopeptidase family protein [Pseudozobellia thermophila]SHI90331.1 Zinc carboxypeptidase [Pseudozobellia thermophila]